MHLSFQVNCWPLTHFSKLLWEDGRSRTSQAHQTACPSRCAGETQCELVLKRLKLVEMSRRRYLCFPISYAAPCPASATEFFGSNSLWLLLRSATCYWKSRRRNLTHYSRLLALLYHECVPLCMCHLFGLLSWHHSVFRTQPFSKIKFQSPWLVSLARTYELCEQNLGPWRMSQSRSKRGISSRKIPSRRPYYSNFHHLTKQVHQVSVYLKLSHEAWISKRLADRHGLEWALSSKSWLFRYCQHS